MDPRRGDQDFTDPAAAATDLATPRTNVCVHVPAGVPLTTDQTASAKLGERFSVGRFTTEPRTRSELSPPDSDPTRHGPPIGRVMCQRR